MTVSTSSKHGSSVSAGVGTVTGDAAEVGTEAGAEIRIEDATVGTVAGA